MTGSALPSIHLRLPATSANLGPGFDSLGLALGLYLTIDARAEAHRTQHGIDATGRDAGLCGAVRGNLILATYDDILSRLDRPAPSLHLALTNEIPLGMGCGSSAAALLAGVHLANHFGQLHWTPQQLLDEACRREGHPDNVAACFHGGMTASSMDGATHVTTTATLGAALDWRLFVALPVTSLATTEARALLPDTYSRADAVANVQNTALLVSAFALGRPDLLTSAMQDRIHQPFRSAACPLLPALLPLAGHYGIHGVALSGAGPSVLLIADHSVSLEALRSAVQERAGASLAELIETRISHGAEASAALS